MNANAYAWMLACAQTTRCIVLHCVAVSCNAFNIFSKCTLQVCTYTRTHMCTNSVLHCVALCHIALHCVALRCSALQCVQSIFEMHLAVLRIYAYTHTHIHTYTHTHMCMDEHPVKLSLPHTHTNMTNTCAHVDKHAHIHSLTRTHTCTQSTHTCVLECVREMSVWGGFG